MFFKGINLQLVTRSCYLGKLVGYGSAQTVWLGEKVQSWKDVVQMLVGG